MLDNLPQIHFTDGLDVMLVAVLLWLALAYLRHTRSRLAMVGVVLLSVVYLTAQRLDLQLTVWILQGFYVVLVLILVVIFQEDLRRFFEQIAVLGLRRRARVPPPDEVDLLVRTVAHQARARTGALYVIPGREPLEPHLEGGIELDARLSEPLLLSLFDPHSPGHDGAAVLAGARLSRFAVHLPLSTNHEGVGRGGTRHAAALGLAERSDALAVVVSEERGSVSVARDGVLRRLSSPELLVGEIRGFLAETAAGEATAARPLGRWAEVAGALLLAMILWAVLVPGADVVEAERPALVSVENLPAGFRLVEVDPPRITVLLEGPRRYLPREAGALVVEVDATLVKLGRRTFRLDPDLVEASSRLTVRALRPESVRLTVEETKPEAPAPK